MNIKIKYINFLTVKENKNIGGVNIEIHSFVYNILFNIRLEDYKCFFLLRDTEKRKK